MTREDKNLLLKDLCARLPYGVKLDTLEGPQELDTRWLTINICNISSPYLPYLFPLSSMTEEQKKEYCSLVWFDGLSAGWNRDDAVILNEVEMLIDFYHKNHLDWRGLIEKGLAIDATGLNIY